jgi:hypothetical protein
MRKITKRDVMRPLLAYYMERLSVGETLTDESTLISEDKNDSALKKKWIIKIVVSCKHPTIEETVTTGESDKE